MIEPMTDATRAAPDPDEVAEALDSQIVVLLADRLTQAGSGHCLRLDDVDHDRAYRLVRRLGDVIRGQRIDANVHVLIPSGAVPHSTEQIVPDRAVELRNRKRRPLLLVVPEGVGAAASSLDSSVKRIRINSRPDPAASGSAIESKSGACSRSPTRTRIERPLLLEGDSSARSGSWRRIARSSSRRNGDGSIPSSESNIRRVVR